MPVQSCLARAGVLVPVRPKLPSFSDQSPQATSGQIQHRHLVVITATVGVGMTVQPGDLGDDRSGTGSDAQAGDRLRVRSANAGVFVLGTAQRPASTDGQGCFRFLQANNPVEHREQEGPQERLHTRDDGTLSFLGPDCSRRAAEVTADLGCRGPVAARRNSVEGLKRKRRHLHHGECSRHRTPIGWSP